MATQTIDYVSQFDGECIFADPDPTKLYYFPRYGNTKVTLRTIGKWMLLAEKHPFMLKKIREYYEQCNIETKKYIKYIDGVAFLRSGVKSDDPKVSSAAYLDALIDILYFPNTDTTATIIQIILDNLPQPLTPYQIDQFYIECGKKDKLYTVLIDHLSNTPKYLAKILFKCIICYNLEIASIILAKCPLIDGHCDMEYIDNFVDELELLKIYKYFVEKNIPCGNLYHKCVHNNLLEFEDMKITQENYAQLLFSMNKQNRQSFVNHLKTIGIELMAEDLIPYICGN